MPVTEKLTYTPGNTIPTLEDALKTPVSAQMNDEERKTFTEVVSRVEAEMLPAQSDFHREWEDAELIYEAYVKTNPTRSSIRVPISHMITEASLAEEIDAFPDLEIDTQEDDDRPKLPMLNACKRYGLAKTNWDAVKMTALRTRRVYGVAPVRVSFVRETRKIKERYPVAGDEGVKVAYRDVVDYVFDDIKIEVITDPRRFLLDPSALTMEEAEDCALRTDVSWNVFRQRFQNDVRYKNVGNVRPGKSVTMDYQTRSPVYPETSSAVDYSKKVTILEYWNKYTDRYVVIANGWVIRDDCLVDDHKELPFAMLQMYRRPHTIYAKGVPKLLESVEAPYNAIINAEVQATKLAFPILTTSEDAGIDPKAISPYPGIVLDGAMDKMKLEKLGSVPAEAYQLKDKLEQWFAWLSGVNYQSIFGELSDRVGIEALKKESQLARINLNLREGEADFIVRVGTLFIEDVMQYYTAPKVRALTSSDDVEFLKDLKLSGPDGRELVLDDKTGDPVGVMEYRRIPVPGVKFSEKYDAETGVFDTETKREEGSNSFILARPEYIRTRAKLDVRAVRPSAMGSSKEAKKLMLIELSNHAMQVNAAQLQAQQPPIWNMAFLQRKVAEVNEIPPEKALTPENEQTGREAQAALDKVAGPLSDSLRAHPLAAGQTQPQTLSQPAPSGPPGGQMPMSPQQMGQFSQLL